MTLLTAGSPQEAVELALAEEIVRNLRDDVLQL